MRRLFDSTGKLDLAKLNSNPHPDEILLKRAKLRMEIHTDESLRQAKEQVLREDPALALSYAKQF